MALITLYWGLDGILILITLMIIFYLYMTRKFKYWKKRGILETAPPIPFFGNFADCLLFKKSPANYLKEIYDQAKGLPYIGFYLMDKPILLIRDPELVKNILVKDFNYFNDRYINADPNDRLGYASLFFLRNPDWKIVRNKITPFFTSGKMKKMFNLMIQCGKNFDDYLDSPEFKGKCKILKFVKITNIKMNKIKNKKCSYVK